MEACAAEPLLGDAERRIMQMGEMERDVVGGAPLRSRLGWSRALLLVPPLLLVGFVTTLLLSSQGVPPPPQHPSHSPHEPSFEVPSFVYRPKYACAICADIVSAEPLLNAGEHACSVFGACESINASTRSCREFCPDLAEQATMPSPVDIAPTLGLRVSKALGSKPYKLLRVSVVTRDDRDTSTPLLGAKRFDYSAPFRFRWTENSLHSSLVRVVPGETTTLDVGGVPVRLSLPHSGEGAAGIMIADTCVSYASLTALVTCTYGVKYELARRLPALLDAFMSGGNASSDPSSELSFWGMLGDNLYDRTGEVSSSFFDSLSLAVKSKPLLTVLGNHDYWILGTPRAATKWDQFGNGFMQFYAQDSYAASELQPGSPEAPFDFSSDPDHGRAHNNPFGGQKVSLPNTFFFNQIGNSGFIGFSGAYPIVETLPLLRDACAALAQTPGVDIVWLLGHWDMENLGCKAHMDVPTYYEIAATLPGCREFAERSALKFIMGHTHCNTPHPHGNVDTGFMVAGQGVEGCGNFGIPIVDTTEEMARIWYFPVVYDPTDLPALIEQRYQTLLSCVGAEGWRGCTHLAKLWLNQSLPSTRS